MDPADWPPLFTDADLGNLPSPIDIDLVESVAGQIREECGWHVAPVIDDDQILDVDGGRAIMLPSTRVLAVTAVFDTTVDPPIPVSEYRWSDIGMITIPVRQPEFRATQVQFRHGFATCPKLLIAAAEAMYLAQVSPESANVASITVGGESVTYVNSTQNDTVLTPYVTRVLNRYRV